jgi:hypothetical protein
LEINKEGHSCLLSGGTPDSPMRHQTVIVDGPVRISFLFWRRRPLHLGVGWRTGQSGVGAGHVSTDDFVVDRCAVDCWLTGQSGAPPDSPVNFSRTPLNFS